MQTHEVVGKEPDGTILLKVTAKPAEVAQMLRTATDLQRLAVGEPTDLQGVVQSNVSIYLPSNERSSDEKPST
jgi:hypothetical protein